MKNLAQVTLFKGFGTIQESRNEDGKRCYLYTHFFSGQTREEDTLKGAREMLEWEEKQAQEIKQAITILSRHNYKVYKEVA